MGALIKNIRTLIAIITGKATVITMKDGDNKEVLIYPSKFKKGDLEKVATLFFREVYNLS
jgi:hypothetical protein